MIVFASSDPGVVADTFREKLIAFVVEWLLPPVLSILALTLAVSFFFGPVIFRALRAK